MKLCNSCKQTKPDSEFSPDKRNKDGLQSVCKVCRTEQARKKREWLATCRQSGLCPIDGAFLENGKCWMCAKKIAEGK
jgi:hypothetical protein